MGQGLQQEPATKQFPGRRQGSRGEWGVPGADTLSQFSLMTTGFPERLHQSACRSLSQGRAAAKHTCYIVASHLTDYLCVHPKGCAPTVIPIKRLVWDLTGANQDTARKETAPPLST